jgi:hypothetical protein
LQRKVQQKFSSVACFSPSKRTKCPSHCAKKSAESVPEQRPTLDKNYWPSRWECPHNGLANSRFHTLLFGINRLRSDELPHCWANSHCSEAFVQLLCNQNSNGLSCRCTPITSANDGASCGFAIFRSAAPKWPIQSIQARLNVVAGATDASRAILLTSCRKVELLTAIFGFL